MSAALKLERSRVSEGEFLALPETMDRVELIDGEVIVPPAPSQLHQQAQIELTVAFREWARVHPPARIGVSPSDVRFAPGRILQPDLYIVLGGFPALVPSPLNIIPDLVVEIVSLNRSYDRITKRAIYQAAGVPEYWIVDPFSQEIEQICGLETIDVVKQGAVSSVIAPGLTVALADIFLP